MKHARITNRKKFIRRFKRQQKNINKAVELGVKHAAKVLELTAKEQAPVDEGPLEDAIKSTVSEANKSYSADIFVDEAAVDAKGRAVIIYAELQHRKLAPAGHWKLGPKSREKQQHAKPGIIVGGEFMNRAVDVQKRDILKAFDATIRGVTRRDRKPSFGRLREWTRLTRGFLRDNI